MIVRSVVLAFGDLVASELARFKAYGSINAYQERPIKRAINACQDISVNVNMAEGPSTTATPSNQFIVKCSVRGHHAYKCIWSPCVGEQFGTFCEEDNEHDKYAVAVHLKKQFNSSWSHPEGDNTHLSLLHQEQRGNNW